MRRCKWLLEIHKNSLFRACARLKRLFEFRSSVSKRKAMRFRSMLARELMAVGDPVGNQIKHRPVCANCGRPMYLARTTPRSEGLSDLRTYSCGECGVWTTKAADDEV
jgi:hypothetical protein